MHFLPQPPISGAPLNFVSALVASGYMCPLIKGTEVLTAVLLLANRFVPLALTLLAPVMVNIIALHLFLEPGALALPLVLLVGQLYLADSYRHAFAPMLHALNTPHVSSPNSERSRLPAAAS